MKKFKLDIYMKALLCIFMLFTIIFIMSFGSHQNFNLTDSVMASGDYIYFKYPIYVVTEDCQSAEIDVCREKNSIYSIYSKYYTSEGTAEENIDYVSAKSHIVMSTNYSDIIDIDIFDDSLAEIDEQFTLSLLGPYTIDDPDNGYYRTCLIIILDDDGGTQPSGNNLIDTLEISDGDLEPAFSNTVQNYQCMVDNSISTVMLKAWPEDYAATMQIDSTILHPGAWSDPIILVPGVNNAEITVTAENGTDTTYVIAINKDVPPIVTVSSTSLSATEGNIINAGDDVVFTNTHIITLTETSGTVSGWSLLMNISQYISSLTETIDDPCLSGGETLDVEIPIAPLLLAELTSVTYPDNTTIYPGTAIDILNSPVNSGTHEVEILQDVSGQMGIYEIVVNFILVIPDALPENTTITCNPSQNKTVLNAADMKQIFESSYSYEVNYESLRIVQP